jgi:hypothetical protein
MLYDHAFWMPSPLPIVMLILWVCLGGLISSIAIIRTSFQYLACEDTARALFGLWFGSGLLVGSLWLIGGMLCTFNVCL